MDSELSFQELSLLVRRQAAHISSRTMTTERRLVFDLLIRLSYDSDKEIAEVSSQSWIAHILGMSSSDVCRAERALLSFRLLDNVLKITSDLRVYRLQPDSSKWGGEKFAWRIADPILRAVAIDREICVAKGGGREAQEDGQDVGDRSPSEIESLAWAFLRNHPPAQQSIANGHHPFVTPKPVSIGTSSTSSVHTAPITIAQQDQEEEDECDYDSVPLPAYAPNPEIVGMAATKPTDKSNEGDSMVAPIDGIEQAVKSPLASQPMPARPASFTVGQAANGALAGQPASANLGNSKVGQGANGTLAGQPKGPTCNISTSKGNRRIPSTDISILASASLESSPQDVAYKLGRSDDLNPENLLSEIRDVVGEEQWVQWNRWWRKTVKGPIRARCAWEALAELKVRLAMGQSGTGKPIRNQGGWLVDQFRRLAKIPHSGRG